MKRRLAVLCLASALCLGAFVVPAAGARREAADKSDNIKLVKNFPFKGGADIAYDGRYVYAVQGLAVEPGGLRIFDPRSLKELAFFKCPTWTDVKPIERGLIAFDGGPGCAGLEGYGVVFLDTRNPRRIKVVGTVEASFHTFRNYPSKRVLYLSPNGCCGDLEGGKETIIDLRNPKRPEIAGAYTSYGLGCHDVWIHVDKSKKIAACAGGAETQLWDVSDPFAPRTLSRIPTPQVFFNHSAAISSDGKLLVVGDEAHVLTECAGGPSGDLWIYDISNPAAPVFKGTFTLDRGTAVSSFWVDPGNEWCSVHNYEFVPGTHTLLAGWYAGGTNVIDLSDPSNPKEIAHYMHDETSVWGAYWIEGRVWATDYDRGLDVYEVEGLRAKAK